MYSHLSLCTCTHGLFARNTTKRAWLGTEVTFWVYRLVAPTFTKEEWYKFFLCLLDSDGVFLPCILFFALDNYTFQVNLNLMKSHCYAVRLERHQIA